MWLLYGVLIFFAIFCIEGYCKGFVKVAYSLVAIIISIILVSALTPYVKDIMVKKTGIYEKVAEKCTVKIKERYEENEETKQGPETPEEALNGAKIKLPKVMKITAESLQQEMQEAKEDCYRKAGEKVAAWIVCVIAFLFTLAVVGLVVAIIGGLLDIVTKLPLIKGVNQILGVGAGFIKGLIIFWVLCILISVFCTATIVDSITTQIYQNKVLAFLYENNGVVYLISYFLM